MANLRYSDHDLAAFVMTNCGDLLIAIAHWAGDTRALPEEAERRASILSGFVDATGFDLTEVERVLAAAVAKRALDN